MGSFACIVIFLSLVGFGQPGTSVMPVLAIDQGPRFAAMGGAGLGAVDDASAIYWNPAGLGRVSGSRLAIVHHEWFAGTKDEIAHAALPAGQGAFGLGLLYSGEPGIEHWDSTNNMLPDSFFRTWNGVLSAGYGFAVAKDYFVGAAAKGFCQSLYTSGGYGGAVDVGFMCRPFPSVSLGAVARNAGFAKYDSTDSMGHHNHCSPSMPTELGIGGASQSDRSTRCWTSSCRWTIRRRCTSAPNTCRFLSLQFGWDIGPAHRTSARWERSAA